MKRRLLLSIHDVSPKFLPQIDRLRRHLVRHGETASVALLVVPDHWRGAPIAQDAAFKAWLRDRHAQGDEIILHGWSHRAETLPRGALDRLRGTYLTAGEGEFLTLDQAEALLRLHAGRALLEDIVGAPVLGFVAPAWLYGSDAHAALAEAGFAFAEDHFRVWTPIDRHVIATGPVISWASRSRPRIASSLLFAGMARHLLARAATVRIAVHPGDTGVASIMESIRTTVRHFRRTHRPAAYADLLVPAASPAAAPRHRETLDQECS